MRKLGLNNMFVLIETNDIFPLQISTTKCFVTYQKPKLSTLQRIWNNYHLKVYTFILIMNVYF